MHIFFPPFWIKSFQLKILGVTVHVPLTNTCFTPEHTHVSGVNRLEPQQTQTHSLSIKLCQSQFGFGHEEQSCYSLGLRLTWPEMRSPGVYLKLQSDMRKIINKYESDQTRWRCIAFSVQWLLLFSCSLSSNQLDHNSGNAEWQKGEH